MKHFVSIGDFSSLSEGMFPIQEDTYCALVPHFTNGNVVKLLVHNAKYNHQNSATQLFPNHNLISVITPSPIECKFPGYTDSKIISPPLVLITLPEGYFIFT